MFLFFTLLNLNVEKKIVTKQLFLLFALVNLYFDGNTKLTLKKKEKKILDKNHLKTSFLPVTLEIKLFRGIGKKHPFLYQNIKKGNFF